MNQSKWKSLLYRTGIQLLALSYFFNKLYKYSFLVCSARDLPHFYINTPVSPPTLFYPPGGGTPPNSTVFLVGGGGGGGGGGHPPLAVLTPDLGVRAVSERWICRCNFDILRREKWLPGVQFWGLGVIFWVPGQKMTIFYLISHMKRGGFRGVKKPPQNPKNGQFCQKMTIF